MTIFGSNSIIPIQTQALLNNKFAFLLTTYTSHLTPLESPLTCPTLALSNQPILSCFATFQSMLGFCFVHSAFFVWNSRNIPSYFFFLLSCSLIHFVVFFAFIHSFSWEERSFLVVSALVEVQVLWWFVDKECLWW